MPDLSPAAQRDLAAMNARTYAMTEADKRQWLLDNPLSNYDPSAADPDAAILRQAAEVLRRRFGVLTAGDLIRALKASADVMEQETR